MKYLATYIIHFEKGERQYTDILDGKEVADLLKFIEQNNKKAAECAYVNRYTFVSIVPA